MEGPGGVQEILCGLDGAPLSVELLSRALSDLLPGQPQEIQGVSVAAGTETVTGCSRSAVLDLSLSDGSDTRQLFIKKVRHAPGRAWADRRRTLCYARTELRFYSEFAPMLVRKGVRLPRMVCAVDRLDVLGDTAVSDPAGDEPEPSKLLDCGALLFLEPFGAEYQQISPLTTEQAVSSLKAVAKLHSEGWEQQELLVAAASRLQRVGGAYSLSIRNPKELTKLIPNWERFCDVFSATDPDLFSSDRVRRLGERLASKCHWLAEQLSPSPKDPFATLMHGDLKAMNLFLPTAGEPNQEAVLIDFASAGVGFGMSDVAMLLSHSVAPAQLRDGGELQLLEAYLSSLTPPNGTLVRTEAKAGFYPREVALRHYKLGLCDYARFVCSRFWTDASPETFASRADRPNTTLVNRSVDAALCFVQRVDAALADLEGEH
eukprot:SAG31_NODE_1626_length_7710_cov_28.409933_5_plen_432_part_00